MRGRCKRHAKGFHSDLLKLEHAGKGLERDMEADEGKSSPKGHVTWQVGMVKENTTAKLWATVARDQTARVQSKQLCY